MKLRNFILCLFFFTGQVALADDPYIELWKKNIITPYENFFQQKRERVYVHFNRSEYLAGDRIWFKAYVYEIRTKFPMVETNKLYIELFDQAGKLADRKIVYISDGSGSGHFQLKETLATGTYTIRAFTNWMRNFDEHPVYSHEFKIQSAGSSGLVSSTAGQSAGEPDIQVFPEGGRFVEGIDNHFGIKVTLPDGHGTEATGSVIGGQNDTLETFTTNHLGFADFEIKAAKKTPYRIVIKYATNKSSDVIIPEPVESGLGMMVNTLFPTKVIIAIKANPHTASLLKGTNILILIHNNGIVYKSSYVNFNESGFISSVPKSQLGPGVNHITIFGPGFRPLAERLIYNHTIGLKGRVDVSHSTEKDSLTFDLKTTDIRQANTYASLSISVLPSKSVGNNFSNSLVADLLLNSSLKGSIESSHYYLESDDFKHQKDLDNLLLTQGWRSYRWPEVLTGKSPEIRYPFEQGFNVQAMAENLFKGKAEKNSKLSLYSPQNGLFLNSEVDEKGYAEFRNLFLGDSTHLVISAANLKGSGSNRNLIASIVALSLDSNIKAPNKTAMTNVVAEPLTAGVIQLNEVAITAQKADPFAGNMYASLNDRVHIITKENYYQYPDMESLLRGKFTMKVTKNITGDLVIDMGRGLGEPTLILNGNQMPDLAMLSVMNLAEVEAIAVEKSGSSFGLGGIINILTRKKPLDWGDSEYKNTRSILVHGYTNNVKFFAPKYILPPASDTYQKFASIYWDPNVRTDSTGKARIRFPVPKELTEFTIRIEGLSPNGTVFYDYKNISTKSQL